MDAKRLHCRGALHDLTDGYLVAEISYLLVVRSIGRWQGSLTIIREHVPIMQRWFDGSREYALDLPGVVGGAVALSPLDMLDPVAQASYTFRGLSLPPTF